MEVDLSTRERVSGKPGERARVGGEVFPVRSSGFRRSTAIPGRHGVSSRAPPTSSPHCPAPTFPFLLPPAHLGTAVTRSRSDQSAAGSGARAGRRRCPVTGGSSSLRRFIRLARRAPWRLRLAQAVGVIPCLLADAREGRELRFTPLRVARLACRHAGPRTPRAVALVRGTRSVGGVGQA